VLITTDSESRYCRLHPHTRVCHVVVTVCRKLKSASLGVISDSRHRADELCALMGSDAPLIGNSVPAFRDILSIPSSRVRLLKRNLNYLTSIDETDRLSLNFGTDLQIHAA
jgi:hypothetical protein